MFDEQGPPTLSHSLVNLESPLGPKVKHLLVLETKKILEKAAVQPVLDTSSVGFTAIFF